MDIALCSSCVYPLHVSASFASTHPSTGFLSALAGACSRASAVLSKPNCTAGQFPVFSQFVAALLQVCLRGMRCHGAAALPS